MCTLNVFDSHSLRSCLSLPFNRTNTVCDDDDDEQERMASATTAKQIEELLERATELEVKKQDNDAAAIYYRIINDES